MDHTQEYPIRWKVSQFVTQVELDEPDILLVYGGLGGRLIEVPAPYRSEAQVLLLDPNASSSTDQPVLRKLFQEQGILIPESWNEVSLLEQHYKASRSRVSDALGLTICPTLNCNFRCNYCYQHHVGGVMPEAIQEKVVQFAEQREPPIKSLSVVWFGGEPLLALPVIKRLSKDFMQLRDGDISYSAYIITNGWKLTRDVSCQLVDLNVSGAQITLDGPREAHDKRRLRIGNRPTFDKIVENIASADPRLRITVRVNIDLRNLQNVNALFDQLDSTGLKGKVDLDFAPVIPYTEVCAGVASYCMGDQFWSKVQVQLQLEALERGYGGPELPQTRGHVCIADSPNGFVITPSGLVFKCWNDVTQPEHAIFDLRTGDQTLQMQRNVERWKNWSPFALTDCVNCPILPQCMGGCLDLGLQQQGASQHGYCQELKHNLAETLATYYLKSKRQEAARGLTEKIKQLLSKVDAGPLNAIHDSPQKFEALPEV